MFTNEFRNRVEVGKYSSWAADMTPDELLGLFWAIGEISCRHSFVPQEVDAILSCAGLDPRVSASLRVLLAYASGHRCSLDEVKKEIVASIDSARLKGAT